MGLGMRSLSLVDGTHCGSHHLSSAVVGTLTRLHAPVPGCFSVQGPLASPCSPAKEVLAAHLADEKTEE